MLSIGIREADIPDQQAYHRRVHTLAALYTLLFVISVAGVIVILWHGRLFVTLAQRTNVETLTLAFFLVYYFYMGVLSTPGIQGALRLFRVEQGVALKAGSREERIERRERAKIELIGKAKRLVTVALNVLIEDARQPGQAFAIGIEDRYGTIGRLKFDGARVTHIDSLKDGSNSLFVFLVQEIKEILADRGGAYEDEHEVEIVEWKKIDDESTEQYLSLATFARNLERHLQCPPLWPKITLTPAEVERLRGELSKLCPALRSEALLPDWEYEGEHKIPIIPEPLGIISISRNEKRVDPIAAMGSALLMLSVTFVILLVIVYFPPWVPSL